MIIEKRINLNKKKLEKYTKLYHNRNQLLSNVIDSVEKFEKPKLPKRKKKTRKKIN
jgi:hypothetical protein